MFLLKQVVGFDGYFGEQVIVVSLHETEADATMAMHQAIVEEKTRFIAKVVKDRGGIKAYETKTRPGYTKNYLNNVAGVGYRVEEIEVSSINASLAEPPGVDAWTAIEEEGIDPARFLSWTLTGYNGCGHEVRIPDTDYFLRR